MVISWLALSGCGGDGERRQPVIAEAYIGPATLKLRQDIPLDSPVAATLRHGDRVEIVGRRRRFLKVRSGGNAEGWTEENLLLNAEEMGALRELAEKSRKLPSQGIATTFDLLNVHTLPARRSPSFTQVKQGDKMEVLAYVVTPRTDPPRKPLIPPRPKKAPAKKKPKEARIPPPPRPTPPGAPANWLEISKTNLPAEPEEPPAPVPTDDWSLVRLPGGQAGWVLTRRLFMNIPDEVAQYAEGARITSYFPLGEVQDETGIKHNWLWTTTASSLKDSDFDSFRVFIWSLRRSRYETAYIERRIKGFLPVTVGKVRLSTGNTGRGAPAATEYPGFSVCVEKADGSRVRRNFAFLVNVVRFAGESACEAVPRLYTPVDPDAPPQVAGAEPAPAPAQPAKPSIYSRVKERISGLAKRWWKR
ncbi:MAG: hypothetical protein ACE15B_24000 [Bryobacteraceae bacterium]